MKQEKLPETGVPEQELMAELDRIKESDLDWKRGRSFSLIYNAGEELMRVGNEAYGKFILENGLSPMAFPSLLKMETEVVSMVAGILGGDENVVGSMTSGGTESIFMATKTARDRARKIKPGICAPEIITSTTTHPAFDKSAHYLGLSIIHVPVGDDYRADVEGIKNAITENTIMMVGSAMTYPHGMVDPIEELAAAAAEKDIWFHVDSCLGGLILPFVKKLGYPVPDFDFSVPGVTSMSADLHKYGFTPKGASTVLYRNSGYRYFQYFAFADFPGGVYGTSTVSGARTGGPIAGAWTVLRYVGENGYLELARKAMDTTKKLIAGVRAIDGLDVIGEPHATVFSMKSDTINVYALSDELHKRGWMIEKQHLPPSLHVTVSPFHENVADEFLAELAEAVDAVRDVDASNVSQEAAMYGMMATMEDRSLAKELAVEYLNDLYKLK